ncbi:MAG: HlyC/CorC family transporter [Bdellovibrionales bacterium]|nr:HlyC/CorC family transporter [Bdellovibrionales bacterium]
MTMLLVPFVFLICCIFGYGLFVLFKASVSRASISTLEKLVEEGVWGAKLSLKVLESADKHILAGHAGRFLCAFGCGVSAVALYQELKLIVESQFSWLPTSLVDFGLAIVLALCISWSALLAVQLAKALAVKAPERILLNFGWLCLALTTLLFPVRALVSVLVQIFERSGRIEIVPSERELTLSAEDLETVIEQSTQAGTLDDNESELLQGALRLSELKVREIMTPRADIVTINEESTIREFREVIKEAGFSRILVTGDHLDDVRGMILVKDLIPLIGESVGNDSIKKYLRDVLFVEGNLSGDDVLRRLRASQGHLAVVLDEHGGVDGIVTLEDLLEEIVGDIFDETDVLDEEQEVTVTVTGELLVDGGTSLSDLESEYGIELPEGEYDTVAGFIIDQLGRIPEVGEQVRCNGSLLRVENVDENRVTQLRISPVQDAA